MTIPRNVYGPHGTGKVGTYSETERTKRTRQRDKEKRKRGKTERENVTDRTEGKGEEKYTR